MNRFFKYTKILLIAILCFSLSLLFVACGEPGEKGDKGDKGDTGVAGVGIVSIVKDSTNGNVDTYKITMSDGSTTFFTVTNSVNNACQHQYGNNIDIVNNCEVRVSTKTCTLCGDNDVVVDNTPHHNYVKKTDTYEHWSQCTVCNVKKDVAAHTITLENECQSCDYTCKPVDGMEFELSDDGEFYSLIKVPEYKINIEVPRYYKGKAVKTIGDFAFSYTIIKEVGIPEGIVEMGEFVFNESDLKHISFPSTLLKVGYIFSKEDIQIDLRNCVIDLYQRDNQQKQPVLLSHSLKITASSDNSMYAMVDGNLYSKDKQKLIKYNGQEERVFIKDGTKKLGEYSFSKNKFLIEVFLPDSINAIEKNTFSSSSVQSINVPNAVTIIENNVFLDCNNLKKVEGMNNVTEIGSFAFSSCKMLDFIMPNNVEKVKTGAFYQAGRVTFQKENKLKEIGNIAFADSCYMSLKNGWDLYIPASVEKIGYEAFKGRGKTSENSYWSIQLFFAEDSNLKYVDAGAFSDIFISNKIVLPNTIETMGEGVFLNHNKVYVTFSIKPDEWNENWHWKSQTYYYSEQPPATSGNWWHYVDGVVTEWPAVS